MTKKQKALNKGSLLFLFYVATSHQGHVVA